MKSISRGVINTGAFSDEKTPQDFLENNHSPIVHASIADIVAERIRLCVMEGVFSSGDKFSETELCEQMGVSRTTIRKAFSILEGEGFLERIPGSGMMVPSLDESEENCYREVLDLLFYTAQRKAKGKISVNSAKKIKAIAFEMNSLWGQIDRTDTGFEWEEHLKKLDFDFHRQILEASGNPLLLECANLVMEKPESVKSYEHTNPKKSQEHRKNHESILLNLGIDEIINSSL